MNWLRQLISYRRMHADLSEEIRQHLEEKVEALLAQGMSRDEAERTARRDFGNVVLLEERSREVWGWPTIESLWADARFAVRQFRKSPGFTITAVFILALGIGVNSAIFSLVHHILLEPLPFPHPERLYAVWASSDAQGDSHIAASGPDFLDYNDQNRSFSHIAEMISSFTFTWTGEGEPKLVNCTSASEQLFSMLGIRPYLGRLYEAREYTYLANDTILISYRFWKNQLGSDPHVIGRAIHFEGDTQTIVGVVPPMPDLFPDTDVWPKLAVRPSWGFMQWRANKFLNVVGRLKPDVSAQAAEEELTGILRRAPGEPPDVRVRLVPLKDDLVGSVHAQLEVITAAVALVLLVACVNVAALLLARAVKRNAEMALRVSLGAGRRRLMQLLIVEGLLLSAVACSFGVLAGWLGLRFIGYLPAWQLPRMEGIHLDAAVLLASAAVAIATTLFFGWVPSLTSNLNLSSALRSGRAGSGRLQRRFFSGLVIAEIACAVVLSVSASLLLRSLWSVQHVDPGFQPESMLTVYLRTNYYSPEGRGFWKGVLDGVASLPGVRSAALADCTPGQGAAIATLLFDDRANDPNHAPPAQGCWTSLDFFRTSGTPLIKGRFFTESDGPDAPPVVIVNAETARRYWPGKNPIGRRIGVNYTGPGRTGTAAPRMREVVGVVGGIKHGTLDSPTEPAVYMPYLQDETSHDMATMSLFVRSSDDPRMLAESVRARIHAVSPDQPVEDLRTMRDLMSRSLAPRRYSLLLLGCFAALAVLLAALGIYGVVSYMTLQRTREFGVRIALGASRYGLMSHVIRNGLVLTTVGAVAGAGVAMLVTRVFSQLLFQVSPLDAVSFASAAFLLAFTSICACLPAAWRASHVDPVRALKSE